MSVINDIDLTPITRLEYDIDAILNDHAVAEPITRIELILADIVAGNTTTVEPVTRIETYLAIISGADYPVPEPVTRIETFLAIIAGEDYEEPEAVTRLEGLLAEWVEKGSGIWKTVTGTLIHITNALASPMRKCEVSLEPIQNLHGQDSPYPAGGGKNLLHVTATSQTINGVTYTVNDDGTVSANGSAGGGGSNLLLAQITLPEGTYKVNGGISSTLYINIRGKVNSYGRSFSSFNVNSGGETLDVKIYISTSEQINVTFYPMICLGTETDPTFAPYSNICPITGWTGCEVRVSNENLIDIDTTNTGGTRYWYYGTGFLLKKDVKYILTHNHNTDIAVYFRTISDTAFSSDDATISNNGTKKATCIPKKDILACFKTYAASASVYPDNFILELTTDEDAEVVAHQGTTLSVTFPDGLINKWDEAWEVGGFNSNGEKATTTNTIRSKNITKVTPSESYFFANGSNTNMYLFWYDEDKNFISPYVAVSANTVITVPANAYYFNLQLLTNYGTTYKNDISINYPATVTDYHPYHDDVVYGCTIDFVSGLLTINEVKLTLNGNSSDGNYSRISSGRFNIDNLPINYFRNESAANSGESSQHKSLPQTSTNGQFDTLAANYSAAFDVSLNSSGNTLRIKDTRFDTVAELQAAYATEKPQFVLTLATPLTYQLTPQQIATLKGENNVWGSGDLEITYKAQAS